MSRRTILESALALGAGATLARGASASPSFAAFVGPVAPSGAVAYPTLAAAVAAAPADGTKPFRIMVGKGQWRERVVIDKPFVHLIGESRDESVVVNNWYAGTPGADGKPIGTFGTATIFVRAPNFLARDLTIANDFDYPGHMRQLLKETSASSGGEQAVALAIEGEADRSFLENVRLAGYQDTLYVQSGRSLFRHCRIEGCVDFIFGAGRGVFDRCNILSRLRPGQDFQGFVAAPDTDIKQPYGLVFHDCRLEKEKDVPVHSVALGRAWRHTHDFSDGRYGDPDNVGAAAYLHCWMDDHIIPEGWVGMGYNRKGGGRAILMPEEARLFEFESRGPGAGAVSARRRQLTADQAYGYADRNVLQDWVPTATD
ncbi:MAG: pectinesterase A [Alphaproteobacteria bacterium]|nr:pectinesterase A [Alphaproteobacteria bacterium]MDE1987534.1 pectinesterase A [Alphaproteobacteria bacterium]MDE2162476.1 pectinesterase A [Alphaproteobacteria bacterium]